MSQERPPALDPALVHEFVLNAHGNFARVQELFAQQPRLLNATWDWGNGDFENALQSASHTGQREIALFLIGHGARIDLFAATMLGHLDVVKSILTAYPNAKNSLGAHDIPLIVHAQMGGEPAKPVLEYLQSLG